MEKLGIFGGTFNPIHLGHLLLAESARTEYALDKVLFIPSCLSYMKNQAEILPPATRYHMVEMAVADNEFFQVSDIEIKRTGPSYTCDTIEELKKDNNELYLIIGADSLLNIKSWKNPDIIMSNARLLVAFRGENPTALRDIAADLTGLYKAEIHFLRMADIEISSTEIRRRCALAKSIKYMVPDRVFEYIIREKLYEDRRDIK